MKGSKGEVRLLVALASQLGHCILNVLGAVGIIMVDGRTHLIVVKPGSVSCDGIFNTKARARVPWVPSGTVIAAQRPKKAKKLNIDQYMM